VVVLDPGHGGSRAVGGSSPNNAHGPNGLLEKNLTLDIARRVRALLSGRARVIMTRDDDTNLSLATRAHLARDNQADVFLSIHLNGFHNPQVDGTEVWVARDASARSRTLAQSVLDHMMTRAPGPNRGVRESNLGVLLSERHAPQTAACLAEVVFLTNVEEARRLEREEYRQRFADAIAQAISLNLHGTGFAAQSMAAAIGGYDGSMQIGRQMAGQFKAQSLASRIRFVLVHSVGKNGVNNGDDVWALKDRLIGLGFDWLSSDRTVDSETIKCIKLFQSIIEGRNTVSGDGRIDVPGATYRWLQAANAPRWQIMPTGSATEGFYNAELADTADHHDYGTNWLANSIKAAAASYRAVYLTAHSAAALLTLNDVSLRRGGDTPDHAGHECGLAADLRLPRTDGTALGATTYNHSLYDRNAARAMLQALRAQTLFSRIFFNDAVLISEGLCTALHGHDDHIHFEIKPPDQGGIELIDVSDAVTASYEDSGWSQAADAEWNVEAPDEAFGMSISTPGRSLQNATCSSSATLVGRLEDNCALLARHGRRTPNLILHWNEIPAGTCEIDVVVHFHGWANRQLLAAFHPPVTPDQMTALHKEGASGLDFLEPHPGAGTSPVRRTRPTLGILPLGHFSGARGRGYDFPFFTDSRSVEGLQQIIDYSLNLLATSAMHITPGSLRRGRLILTAHSGGGSAISQILRHTVAGSGTQRVRRYNPDELHLFDALYSDEEPVIDWATARMDQDMSALPPAGPQRRTYMLSRGGALRAFYRPCAAADSSETETHSRCLNVSLRSRLTAQPFLIDWYRVQEGSVEHEAMPASYGFALLADASATVSASSSPSDRSRPACAPAWSASDCHQRRLPNARATAPASSHSIASVTALDDRRHSGPLPYREAVAAVNERCNLHVAEWASKLNDAEARLARGLMPRLPLTALQDLDAEQSCYSVVHEDHANHRRRLQAVLDRVRAWIFDITQSAIGQIENDTQRNHFLTMNWSPVRYPGNPGNTTPAANLFSELARLVPERRVPHLVNFIDIDNLVVDVPNSSCPGCGANQHGQACRLLPVARDSFVAMRAAANATQPGVVLRITSGWRSATTQQNLGAAQPNRVAVAGNRSAHRYGLAIDLCLSVTGLRLRETTTEPVTGLVEMYKSPAYKWMFLHAAEFGWYPYRNEPWHWEYNPPGFPEGFAALVRDTRAAQRTATGTSLESVNAPSPPGGRAGGPAIAQQATFTHPAVAQILEHVNASPLVNYSWKDRGKAKIGYLKGMALSYARVYCKYSLRPGEPENFRDQFTVKMAKGIGPHANPATDAIAKYANQLRQFGADVSVDGVDVLRGLFTILIGLGMRESAGKHCVGWDRGKITGWGNPAKAVVPTATNAEAGLFQISYDIGVGPQGDFKDLYERYKRRPSSGFLQYFSEDVTCSVAEAQNFGAGVGQDFQQFSKECPAFTVELAALALRTRADHWNPIITDKVELRRECWSLLVGIETAIDDLDGCIAVD
jgi:hypothetical protein